MSADAWRDIAIHDPRLWTCPADGEESERRFMWVMLQRAGSVPLELHITGIAGLLLVVKHLTASHNVSSFNFSLVDVHRGTYDNVVSPYLHFNLAALKSLTLCLRKTFLRREVDAFSAPGLRTLILQNWMPAWSTSPIQNLAVLSLTLSDLPRAGFATHEPLPESDRLDVLDLLRRSPRLQQLTLAGILENSELGPPGSGRLALPDLTYLCLRDTIEHVRSMLQCLDTPALRNLDLGLTKSTDTPQGRLLPATLVIAKCATQAGWGTLERMTWEVNKSQAIKGEAQNAAGARLSVDVGATEHVDLREIEAFMGFLTHAVAYGLRHLEVTNRGTATPLAHFWKTVSKLPGLEAVALRGSEREPYTSVPEGFLAAFPAADQDELDLVQCNTVPATRRAARPFPALRQLTWGDLTLFEPEVETTECLFARLKTVLAQRAQEGYPAVDVVLYDCVFDRRVQLPRDLVDGVRVENSRVMPSSRPQAMPMALDA